MRLGSSQPACSPVRRGMNEPRVCIQIDTSDGQIGIIETSAVTNLLLISERSCWNPPCQKTRPSLARIFMASQRQRIVEDVFFQGLVRVFFFFSRGTDVQLLTLMTLSFSDLNFTFFTSLSRNPPISHSPTARQRGSSRNLGRVTHLYSLPDSPEFRTRSIARI